MTSPVGGIGDASNVQKMYEAVNEILKDVSPELKGRIVNQIKGKETAQGALSALNNIPGMDSKILPTVLKVSNVISRFAANESRLVPARSRVSSTSPRLTAAQIQRNRAANEKREAAIAKRDLEIQKKINQNPLQKTVRRDDTSSVLGNIEKEGKN